MARIRGQVIRDTLLVFALLVVAVLIAMSLTSRHWRRVAHGDSWVDPWLQPLICVHSPGPTKRAAQEKQVDLLQRTLPDNPSIFIAMDRIAAAYAAEGDAQNADEWRQRATESCKRYGSKACDDQAWWRASRHRSDCSTEGFRPSP